MRPVSENSSLTARYAALFDDGKWLARGGNRLTGFSNAKLYETRGACVGAARSALIKTSWFRDRLPATPPKDFFVMEVVCEAQHITAILYPAKP